MYWSKIIQFYFVCKICCCFSLILPFLMFFFFPATPLWSMSFSPTFTLSFSPIESAFVSLTFFLSSSPFVSLSLVLSSSPFMSLSPVLSSSPFVSLSPVLSSSPFLSLPSFSSLSFSSCPPFVMFTLCSLFSPSSFFDWPLSVSFPMPMSFSTSFILSFFSLFSFLI
uniref:Uncharacterized protein n=1 Tax=Myotis myotis TaxID=51298 RepID=A0A7J7RK92_MYOMY|nr:hypothetical protein mMyoMyo1_010287 [Myotis myotis]